MALLDFSVIEYDKKESIECAEMALAKYRHLLYKTDDDYLPATTSSFSLEMPNLNNQFHSGIEAAIERKEADSEYMQSVWKAVNRMREEERRIIVQMYIIRNNKNAQQMRNIMLYGKTRMWEKKREALFMFAQCFGVAIIKEGK